MATLEFFDFVRAEAGEGGDVWLHGGGGEAGLYVQFPAGNAEAAARIAAAINGRGQARGQGIARGQAEPTLAPGSAG